MTQPSAPNEPRAVDWQNPAWTADTEALANCLWRLIQIYKTGRAPAIRPASSEFCVRASAPIAQEPARE